MFLKARRTTPRSTGCFEGQLRHPQEARFTEDVDLRLDAEIHLVPAIIVAAAAFPLDDPFSFELTGPPRALTGPPGGLRFVVVTSLFGQELVRFKVDVSSRDAVWVGRLVLSSTRAAQAVHELDRPAVEGARELIAECGDVRLGEPLAQDPRLQTLDQLTGLDRPHRW